MKVLVVAPRFPSINQPWMDTYIEQLVKNGFVPVIYTNNANSNEYSEKVDNLNMRDYILKKNVSFIGRVYSILKISRNLNKIITINRKLKGNMTSKKSILISLVRLLDLIYILRNDTNVHVIHSHSERLTHDFINWSLFENIPIILTFHGLPPKGINEPTLEERQYIYQNVKLVLVNTNFSKNQVINLGCNKDKVKIVPQGLPIKDFPFSRISPPSRHEKLKIITVGRYHRDKGQAYALIALKRLLDAGHDVEWTFIGVGPDKPRLQRIAKELGVTNQSKFLEGLTSEELRTKLRASHIFILPSVHSSSGHVETQGVVIQEAQATGCIVIASKVGGIPECITDNQDGFLVKDKSSRSIFSAIEYLINNKNEWTVYQDNGRRTVERDFSSDIMGDKISEIIKSLSH